ncbi:glycoside hydrolase family 18 [Neobacillus sp. MM2021_6]|uniref:glycosyl hydrolase family 18 protein n=1 Tax=Bacillaceae TaxID=186817 RepID=UPI00140AA658|nr:MULTISPECIES: glycosyl hydrolase family 18 protein [Bacillaceae]MBO0962774.1 glycoside hydrolase family 18 [Neobacillus sp. MM2021_6]NHC21168.1 glycoside hydrolase family 18 [Bacillus sp. MM2020_4]
MVKNCYRSFPIISLCMAIFLLSSCSRMQGKEEHKNHKSPREVLGFYTEKEGTFPSSQPTVNSQSANLSIIAPFWYKLDDKRPGNLIASVPSDHKRKVIQSAHDKNLKVYMVVHNLFYETVEKGKQVASNVLDNDHNSDVFIQNLRNEMNQFNYDGMNVDMENLNLADRDSFSQLIKKLSDAAHCDGKVVTVSVPANTGDSRANPWSPWFDYEKLGRYSDGLLMMTYDEHNPRTTPGSTASVDWTVATIRYALKQGVPPSKMLLGIAGYGWDWDTTAGKTKYSSYKELMGQKTKYKANVIWDSRSQTPHFDYIDEAQHSHQVWFENSESLQYKLDLVEKFHLRGIGIWRLGLEDPMYWKTISEKIKVKK